MATINATTSQGGYLDNQRAASLLNWSDIIDGSAGYATTSDVNGTYMYTRARYQGGRSAYWACSRSYLVFNTSAITGTLTALSLNVYVETILDLNYSPDAIVQLTNLPTLSDFLLIDHWQYTSGQVASDPFYPYTQGWENIGLNANAVSVAETENEMTVQIRDNYYDYDYGTNLASPSADGYIEYRYNYASYIPYLDYTMVTGYGKIVNGIIAANMSKVDGIAKASISKVIGV